MQRDETDGERQKDSEYNIKAEDLERQKRRISGSGGLHGTHEEVKLPEEEEKHYCIEFKRNHTKSISTKALKQMYMKRLCLF